jgi:hypothetical protein
MRVVHRWITKGPRPARKMVPYRKPPTLRVGRNQLCPCKSGKKFKHCCLPKIQALENTPPELRQQAIVNHILGKSL